MPWKMAASTSFLSPNIWSRVQTSLGKPLVPRCRDIEEILKTSTTKDVSSILPALLESIFGSGSELGWGLDVITRTYQPHEFEALLQLLAPQGPILTLIYQLQTDPYLTYDFPFQNLPAPARRSIEEGSIPMFYVNKLQYQSYTKPALSLSAFEVYMFYYAHALVSSQWQAKAFNWNNLKEVVYPRLLEDYLHHFLPQHNKGLPKFPQAPQIPVRSSLLHQQQQHTPLSSGSRQLPGSGTQTRSRSLLGLLKPNVLSPQKQHGQTSPGHEKAEGEIWWSETFIQVVSEFWLNQNTLENERGITPQNLSVALGYRSAPFQSMFESFLPSNNHVRLTRILLKHLHSFVGCAEPEIVLSQYQSPDISPLEDFKRNLVPSVLQKKLYSFFRHSFERWPLDTSFRLVLEMWLTYVQPWRYTDSGRSPSSHTDKDAVQDSWFAFIRDNLLFYTVLFQDFVERCRRSQLTSVYHGYMLFRVSKVFSLPNLPQLLREAERMMHPCGYKSVQEMNNGSYIAPDMSPVLRIQIAELERQDFTYCTMFDRDMEAEVYRLLQQVDNAVASLQACQETSPAAPHSLWGYVSSLFADQSRVYGDLSLAEVKKLVNHLEQAKHNLAAIFSIKPTDVPSSSGLVPPFYLAGNMGQNMAADQSSLLNQSLSSSICGASPDCEMTEDGYQLTNVGRYQLMNGLRRFEIRYQGDPDLQPIRSFENATIVRALYKLSSYTNKHFSSEIESLYQRDDLLGRLCQVYFAAPLSGDSVPRSPMSACEARRLARPRVSLRVLGSYQALTYLLLLYVGLWLGWGVGPVGYTLVLLLTLLLYGLVRVLLTPRHHTSPQRHTSLAT